MARIRTIKPDFFKNEQISELSAMHRLLFIGLWTQADREGKLEDRPKRLKVEIFPYDNFDLNGGLHDLQEAGLLIRYANFVDQVEINLIKILTFQKHQQPNIKEAKSIYPEPVNMIAPYKHNADTVLASQERKGTGKEQEGKGREGDRVRLRFSPPTFDEVFEYFFFKKELEWGAEKIKIQAQKFIDHYESNGWHVGKIKMASWKSAASGWMNRDVEFSKNNNSNFTKNDEPKKSRIRSIAEAGRAATDKALAAAAARNDSAS